MEELRKKKQFDAEKALRDENYSLAVELFSSLYSEQKSARENFFLVKALAGTGQFEAALEIAQEYMNSYLAEDQRLVFYIYIAVNAKQALKVYQLLESLKPYMTEKESQLFYGKLDLEVKRFYEQNNRSVTKQKKQLQYLGLVSPLEQRKIAKEANALTYQDFIDSVKPALIDENVHPLVRASFLNDLRLLNVSEKVAYLPFLRDKLILCPEELQGIQETKLFKNYAAQLLGNITRPVNISQQILGEITLKLMLLYPDFTEIKRDQDLWMHVLLNEKSFLDSDGPYAKIADDLEKSIAKWQPKSK
ncbi:MAG TPA: hypothetical protein H9803_09425 [Candidatus Ligilactobacillus excrementavium]|nr:hypothetical protein [Candidatus Ligilactobacillus excrementavium]